MKHNDLTVEESFQKLRSSMVDLLYELIKAFGIIKIVKKIPCLELRDWVKRRI